MTPTEDLSVISAGGLRDYDAVFFFTSGELALDDAQKAALLAFVRSGKGFGGAHSATDTLYTWPEYKTLIGATFDGHPWVRKVRIDVEEPDNPIVRHLVPGSEIEDEIYQHRDFSRDRLRVLMSLDTSSVDLNAAGVNRTDGDFALAWVQPFGTGRVFYTALGHFEQTWRDPRFQQMLRQALLWLTGQIDAPSEAAAGRGSAVRCAGGRQRSHAFPRGTFAGRDLQHLRREPDARRHSFRPDAGCAAKAGRVGGQGKRRSGAAVLRFAGPDQRRCPDDATGGFDERGVVAAWRLECDSAGSGGAANAGDFRYDNEPRRHRNDLGHRIRNGVESES